MRRITFQHGQFYHLYNRGVEKRIIFSGQADYDRFEAYLYLLNDTDNPRAANFFNGRRNSEIFTSGRSEQLVALGAYCLMPNHFHILASPLARDGISRFMQKIQTAYTMYFNDKYSREGSLLQGTFKAENITGDEQLKYVFANIHLNPAKLFNADWREKESHEFRYLASSALDYRYSSAGEYLSSKHIITSPEHFPKFMSKSRNLDSHIRDWVKYRNPASKSRKRSVSKVSNIADRG